MKRVLGFCLTPLGGILFLFHFSRFVGLLVNAWSHFSDGAPFPLFFLEDGAYVILGTALFTLGARLLKGEIGVVFICIGCAALIAAGLGILQLFFWFTGFHSAFYTAEFAANCLLLVCAVVLIFVGIGSFSKRKDEHVLDDETRE